MLAVEDLLEATDGVLDAHVGADRDVLRRQADAEQDLLTAVGLDPTDPFYYRGRPFQKAAEGTEPIKEILS